MDEVLPRVGIAKRPSSNLIGGSKTMTSIPRAEPTGKQGYPITFKHLGKGGYELTLYASTHVQRRKWVEFIEAQQKTLRSQTSFFTKAILCANFFTSVNRVNCLVPIGSLSPYPKTKIRMAEQYINRVQMAAANSSLVPTTAFTSRTADPRKLVRNPSECLNVPVSLRSRCSKSINYYWCCPTRLCSRILWRLWN